MKKILALSLMAVMAIAAIAQFPTRIYLCGPAGPDWATEQWPMYTYVAEDGITPTGVYEWVGDLKEGQLKFLYGSSWEPAFVAVTDGESLSIGNHQMTTRLSNADPDNKWVATAGRYKLTITLAADSVLTVADGTGLADKNGNEQTFKPAVPANVYPVGDGTQYGWNEKANEPIAKAEGADVFDGVVFLKNGEFKLLHQPDWGAQYGPITNGENITGAGTYTLCKPSDDNKWVISGIDELTAFHMIADVEAGTLVLRDTNVVLPPCTTLYMIGEAIGGWSFDDNAVELTSEDSVFTYTGTLAEGEFKFFEKKDFGSQAWGAAEEGGVTVAEDGEFDLVKLSADNKFYVLNPGTYTVVANLKTGKINITTVTALHNVNANVNVKKMIENGQMVIIKDGVRYGVTGAKL